ncbi:MAG: hypothetical protein KGJ53_15190 [Alphaproteobacteria bacterium]|nr:hypothetical protein [Alphaproteobacteria bacterium]
MVDTIFFSWQLDTDPKTGRNLIDRVMNRVVGSIGSDATVDEAVRDLAVDSDTKDAPGFPPIVDTIFRKIDAAAVFVPDLTFVGKRLDGRPTPNPNVLIEYGWALKSLTYNRIVPVMNTHYGEPTAENMPFDMGHLRRPIRYNCPPDADEAMVKRVKAELGKQVEGAIRAVLESKEYLSLLPSTPEPVLFQERNWEGTRGRFKGMGIPIGVTTHTRFGMRATDVKLVAKPVAWLRVMPRIQPDHIWRVAELQKLATQNGPMLLPLAQSTGSLGYFRSDEGFGIYEILPPDSENSPSVVMAFTNGEVWGVDAWCLELTKRDDKSFVPPMERELRAALSNYANFLVRMGIEPPFRWEAGMENLSGRIIAHGNMPPFNQSGPCLKDVVVESGSFTPGESPAQSLRPFFLKLYDACGADRPPEMDKD